jgi:hypothetical protein
MLFMLLGKTFAVLTSSVDPRYVEEVFIGY